MYSSCLVTFFKEDMFTLFKFIFKIVLTVQVFHWMLAEADLFLPGVREFAISQLQTYQIPTHQAILTEGALSFGDVGQKVDKMLANVAESPFKMDIPNALVATGKTKLQDLKYIALNQLPINPVEVFQNKQLRQVFNTGETNSWQEF